MQLSLIAWILPLVCTFFVSCQPGLAKDLHRSFMKDEIPAVDFCEMVIHPQAYLEKTTRIKARILPFDEGLYILKDNTGSSKCAAPLGALFANNDAGQIAEIRKSMDLIHTADYGFRANITITGVLHKKEPNYFSRVTAYQFEIIRFEQVAPVIVNTGPFIDFCEMVKHPERYFDKTIKTTAVFSQADEGAYLSSDKCPLTHDEQIGISSAVDVTESQRVKLNSGFSKIGSPEYGSRALVTVTGILRNVSLHAFAWYQYRFDIISFDDILPIVIPYEGKLDGTITYRGEVYSGKDMGLSLVKPFRIPEHYAYRIEWTNLKDFPKLKNTNKTSPKTIVFSILSNQIKQMTENRWNITIECKIIRID